MPPLVNPRWTVDDKWHPNRDSFPGGFLTLERLPSLLGGARGTSVVGVLLT